MSDLDHTQYQAGAFLELTQIIKAQKIPNAWLFSGDKNTGREQAALYLAKGCNCLHEKEIVCNKCKSCRKIDAKSHPDILYVDLEKNKKILSIDQIRKMGLKITSKSNEAKFRIVLILNADTMNNQAQNALLKMLEEPPAKTFFILIAKTNESLLPTIISRTRKIRFKPLSYKNIEQNLIVNFNIDKQMAHIVARTSDSDIKKALMYLNLDNDENSEKKKSIEKTDWLKKRIYLLKTVADIILSNNTKSISKSLMLSQKISLDLDTIDDTIAIMKTFFRDLMIFKYNRQQLVNIDFADIIQNINFKIKSNVFSKWLENLFEIEKKITANSSPKLALDNFFLLVTTNKGNQNI